MNRQSRRRLAGLLGVCSLLGVPVQAEVPVTVEAQHFGCIREMTPVRHFYLTNLLGNLPASLAALVVCTVVGVFFRGPEMRLVWPFGPEGGKA